MTFTSIINAAENKTLHIVLENIFNLAYSFLFCTRRAAIPFKYVRFLMISMPLL